MNSKVTIIMYHYVRDFKNSRFSNIKGLDLELFIQQIKFLEANFNIVKMEEVIEAAYNKDCNLLPKDAALLTFDDGYIDHYTNVFPILKNRGIQGSFFVSAKPLVEHKVMDVNKIHYLLAIADIQALLDDVFSILNRYRIEGYSIESNENLFRKFATASRFDCKEVIFIKRILQVGLEEKLRNMIVQELFNKYLDVSEEVLSNEWYLNLEQMHSMKEAGMYFGIHGYEHYWLGKLSEDQMKEDIEKALDCFDGIIDKNSWVMNYPYGSYNEEVVNFVRSENCKLGLTTEVKIADIYEDNIFELPRLDTNDLPPKSENYCDMISLE